MTLDEVFAAARKLGQADLNELRRRLNALALLDYQGTPDGVLYCWHCRREVTAAEYRDHLYKGHDVTVTEEGPQPEPGNPCGVREADVGQG
jgi:hypothetical protein